MVIKTGFVDRYPDCRYITTCRILSYANPDWQLNAKFSQTTLAPFSPAQIKDFIYAWYEALLENGSVPDREKADILTQSLQNESRRSYLRDLASNPLLLTVMAVVHTHKGRLPGSRAVLYEECIEILLYRWEQVKAADQGCSSSLRDLLSDAGRQTSDLLRLLRQLAFDVHGQASGDKLADIGRLELQKRLCRLHPDESIDWAEQVIYAIRERAGLLIEREEDVYTFPHRTFQEYLAGAHLSGLGDFSKQAAQRATDPNWRQVILLAVGYLTFCALQNDPVRALLDRLCPVKECVTPEAWYQCWLAGEAVLEMERKRLLDDDGEALDRRIRLRLQHLLQKGALQPKERVAAGNVLSRLGDSRFRADRWYLPDEELLGFVEIPEGEFVMGDNDDELSRPQHSLNLQRFFIGRYPVTVSQFTTFVEASGYSPSDADSLDGIANHPVILVNWYDAMEYCMWLDQQLRRAADIPAPLADLLNQGWQVGLPSEAEWEKAARGTDGRMYPWDNAVPKTHLANYDETGINAPTPVGCFSAGNSPYGLADCVGNVYEWTRSLWGEDWGKPDFIYPYTRDVEKREKLEAGRDVLRVLRGGSCRESAGVLGCACRYGDYPDDDWSWDRGFRVVLAPNAPFVL